jgi:hypothetical protein
MKTEKRQMLWGELMKLQKLEEALDRADSYYPGTQLLQIVRAIVYFFGAVCQLHVGTEQESLQSSVRFLEFLTKRLHASSFVISWTEMSSMPLFAREMPTLMRAVLADNRLPLLQTLFQTLEPVTKELDWMRTTYELLRAVVDDFYATRGLASPPFLSSSLPSPPPPTESSTLAFLPLSSSYSSSPSSPSSSSSRAHPSPAPAAAPPPRPVASASAALSYILCDD